MKSTKRQLQKRSLIELLQEGEQRIRTESLSAEQQQDITELLMNLLQACGHAIEYPAPGLDMRDIRGQWHVKRALEVAAAGGHNILLVGPPGAGKIQLARALRSLLPKAVLFEWINMGERMVVANRDRVETYNHRLSELRQSFFERPDGGKLVSYKLPHMIEDLRTHVSSYGSKQSKRLLGQVLHLSSLLACFRMNYWICLRESNEMIDCARESCDVDMEVAARIRQGLVAYYQFKPTQRHYAFCRAMQLVNKVQSPLIRARVFFGYAESRAASGQLHQDDVEHYSEAERHVALAESLSVPGDDPGHAYVTQSRDTQKIDKRY